MQCIFCNQDAKGGRKREHIIPESLGGGHWYLLPPGIVCDPCNQYFGSKIERIAIDDYPLNMIRLMNGVITKKKKWATLPHYRGLLEARPIPGLLGIEPVTDEIEQAILDGRITQFRVLAETCYPLVLCRMLLKIGLEAIADDCISDAYDKKYDAARQFARAPRTSCQWWFVYHGELNVNPNIATDTEKFNIIIRDIGGGEIVCIKIFSFTFILPMTSNIVPQDLQCLPEPEYRFHVVTA